MSALFHSRNGIIVICILMNILQYVLFHLAGSGRQSGDLYTSDPIQYCFPVRVCVCVCPYFSLYIFAFAFVLAINIQFEFSIRENGLLHWPSTIKTWSSNRKLITTLKNDVILLNCNLQMERRFMRLAFSLSLFFYLFNSPYLSVSQPFMAMNERNGSKMKMH